jgi:hypothetical protein
MSQSELFRIAIQKGNRPPDAKQRALDMYKPPFRYGRLLGLYEMAVINSNGKSVCTAALHRVGELIAEALNEYYANHAANKCQGHLTLCPTCDNNLAKCVAINHKEK